MKRQEHFRNTISRLNMSKKTVLIVDDSMTARLIIKSILEQIRPDWQILQAPSAKDAIAMDSEHSIDFFVIDYHMPETTGLELIEKLPKRVQERRTVLLTANIQPQISERAKMLNALCLHKPITEDIIKKTANYFNE
jgi:CheY-like chemotaxis protein